MTQLSEINERIRRVSHVHANWYCLLGSTLFNFPYLSHKQIIINSVYIRIPSKGCCGYRYTVAIIPHLNQGFPSINCIDRMVIADGLINPRLSRGKILGGMGEKKSKKNPSLCSMIDDNKDNGE